MARDLPFSSRCMRTEPIPKFEASVHRIKSLLKSGLVIKLKFSTSNHGKKILSIKITLRKSIVGSMLNLTLHSQLIVLMTSSRPTHLSHLHRDISYDQEQFIHPFPHPFHLNQPCICNSVWCSCLCNICVLSSMFHCKSNVSSVMSCPCLQMCIFLP